MSKRTATTELTDANWDKAEEPEEAGIFKRASSDVISQRPIMKAKRKYAMPTDTPGSFSGFSGFSLHSSKSKNGAFSPMPVNDVVSEPHKEKNGSAETDGKNSAYFQNLKNLNESVLSWIQQHVQKNPFCILTPIFKDYGDHLSDIGKEDTNPVSHKKDIAFTKESSDEKPDEVKKNPLLSSFNSQAGALSNKGSISSGFVFKSSQESATPFSFGSSISQLSQKVEPQSQGTNITSQESAKPFSFGSSISQLSQKAEPQSQGKDEDDYVPPEPETREIKEDGEIYKNRCKLFYQKDSKWIERAVGNVHLKPDDKRLQLIIRADTNLGNIVLNVFLNSSIPIKKQGKNNVSFVCVPNPPLDPKVKSSDPESTDPVPMLIRVKTSDDADTLIKTIQDHVN